ncbi:MAG: type II secretion system F family protein [Candidatus Diapherotrites archaeon]
MYQRIAAILPKSITEKFKQELEYLGIDINERKFVGFLVVFSLALSLGIAVNLYLFFQIPFIISFVFFALLFFGGVYAWLSIMSESKGRYVEKILPDALQMIASNIKSGLTTERALLVSARPEFGPLETELKEVSKRIAAGERIEVALMQLPKKIRSKILERTVWLISKGIGAGGQIADLLLKLSDDLREENSLQEETKANVSIYIILILFASAVGAPLLFGVSSFIVQVLYKQISTVPSVSPELLQQGGGSAATPIISSFLVGNRNPIKPDFAVMIVSIILVVGSVFASMTIGVINTGKEKGGFKYILPFILISFAIFFAVRIMLASVFGQLV